MSSQQLMAMRMSIKGNVCCVTAILSPVPVISAPQKRALAGVGSPIKELVCLSSRLNFANLSAEKAAITNAMNGINLATGSKTGGYSI